MDYRGMVDWPSEKEPEMDGYRGRDYYTKEEFDEACTFNYWFGAIAGIIGTIVITSITILGILWTKNII